MVRVLQPAGFTRLNLLHIGLNDDFDEVVFLCSPESMNELEYERIVSTAKELGSKATFSRYEIPVVGPQANVEDLIQNLKKIKDDLGEMETIVSTTGGPLKLGACLSYVFPGAKTVIMDWNNEMYVFSNGEKKPMKNLSEEIRWKLLGLHLEIENGISSLYHDGELVAVPTSVTLRKNKLFLEWKNDATRIKLKTCPVCGHENHYIKSNKGKTAPPKCGNCEKNLSNVRSDTPAAKRAKVIAGEMGRLCRINSEHRYHFSVPLAKFSDYDRYPIKTKRPVQPNKFFNEFPNEFFSRISLPNFPIGETKSNRSCLHIIVNINDITPTAEAILAHRPDHVVLWFLDNDQDQHKSMEYEGKIGFLTAFIHGTLTENLSQFKAITESKILRFNPLEELKAKFHLARIANLEEITLHTDFPKVDKTIFETNSGFIGFQNAIIRHLEESSIKFERWHTDLVDSSTSKISFSESEKRYIKRDVSKNLLLRKRIPTMGHEISTEPNYMEQLAVVMEAVVSSKYMTDNGIWRLNEGEYKVGENSVRIQSGPKPKNSKKKNKNSKGIPWDPYEFKISLNEEPFIQFGEAKNGHPNRDVNKLGLWLEELAGHMVHLYWKSSYTVIGLNSQPFTGSLTEIGSNDDIDIYCLTQHGEVISEVKAKRSNQIADLVEPIDQLSGEIAVIGNRKGQVPIITIGSNNQHLDAFAKNNNVVICNWWELQYPDHILHRLRTGERSDGELKLAEKVKLAENLRIAKEEAAAAAKRKEEEEAEAKKKGDREAEAMKKAEAKKQTKDEAYDSKAGQVLFAGEISLEQIHAYPGSEFACTILGIAVLEGEVISISRTRFKKLFYPNFTNPNTVGYHISVSRKKPESLSKSKNLVKESKAYMDELKDIPRIERE